MSKEKQNERERDIHYFDSSVILRYAINHVSAIANLERYSPDAYTSSLTQVECLRVLDRWRLTREISEIDLVNARSLCLKILHGLKAVSIDESVLYLAAQSFPIAIKSLDAIHLATALLLKKQSCRSVKLLTHDAKFSLAAQAMEIETVNF